METHICVYCGQPATHQFKNGKWCCKENSNLCPEMRRIRSEKAKIAHQKFKEKYGDARAQRGQSVGRNPAYETKYPSCGDHVCVYCGGHAEYQLKDGRWCCQPKSNSCPTRRKQSANKRNPDGTPVRDYKAQYQHFSQQTKDKILRALRRTNDDPVIRQRSNETHRRKLKTGEITPPFLGKHHTLKSKQKLKLAAMKRFEENGIKIYVPNFNNTACAYIDQLNESKGWHLQHALNGGEIRVDNYFLDGYDKELNIAFEYDEPSHYTEQGELRERDVFRMNYIHQKLGCRFFRYNEAHKLLYEVNFT